MALCLKPNAKCDLCLERGFFSGAIKLNEAIGWTLIQCDQCTYKRGIFGHSDGHDRRKREDVTTHAPHEDMGSEWCFYEPEARRQSWRGSFPSIFRESTVLPTPWCQTPGLHNQEKINVCCLTHCPPANPSLWYLYAAALGNSCNNAEF